MQAVSSYQQRSRAAQSPRLGSLLPSEIQAAGQIKFLHADMDIGKQAEALSFSARCFIFLFTEVPGNKENLISVIY